MTKHSTAQSDIRFLLSRETRALHDVVDDQAEHNDLSTPEGVGGLIRFFHRGFSRIEAALDAAGAQVVLAEWQTRKRTDLLEADLSDMGLMPGRANADDGAVPLTGSLPEFHDEAEIWGALYVIEGSRLGARMMVRVSDHTRQSRFLSESATCRFWPDFLAGLSAADERLSDREGMVRGAQKAFQAFLP